MCEDMLNQLIRDYSTLPKIGRSLLSRKLKGSDDSQKLLKTENAEEDFQQAEKQKAARHLLESLERMRESSEEYF